LLLLLDLLHMVLKSLHQAEISDHGSKMKEDVEKDSVVAEEEDSENKLFFQY